MNTPFRRKTNETDISLTLSPCGEIHVETPSPFLSHMLEQLVHHAGWGIDLHAEGDTAIDAHHLTEDTGILLGQALLSLREAKPIRRYGWAVIPMDGSCVLFSVDAGGRGGCFFEGGFPSPRCGDFDMELVPEFFRALAREGRMTLHIRIMAADNSHHAAEAVFKAAGIALSQAFEKSGRDSSTKGIWT
jgi:imidazoleglycerol-phosphate dehydratase